MSEVCCKRCGATDHVKNGNVRGFQRYLCLSCGCNFTMTPPRGNPPAMKALALLLYAMGNVSFGSIARILGVSDVAVLNWVRDEARKLPEPSIPRSIRVAAKKGRPCYASLIPNERLRNWRLLNKSLLN